MTYLSALWRHFFPGAEVPAAPPEPPRDLLPFPASAVWGRMPAPQTDAAGEEDMGLMLPRVSNRDRVARAVELMRVGPGACCGDGEGV